METQPLKSPSAPPGLIPTFVTGFNTVASHIDLIIAPLLFDLLLLFGPRVSLEQVIMPVFDTTITQMQSLITPSTATAVEQARVVWQDLLQRFNLLSTLRTYPVGLPSLLSGQGVIATPLGAVPTLDITSANLAVAIWLLLVLIGILFGSFFFNRMAALTGPKKEKATLATLLYRTQQLFFLTVIAFIIMLIVGLPLLGTLAIFSSSAGGASQILIIGATVLILWFTLPLVFSTHGIFVEGKPFMQSVFTSIRLVRYFLPWTSLFLMTAVLLNQGLNTLWLSAPTSSWLILIGIGGHAFISTALLTASFVYYQDGLAFMQATLKRIAEQTTTQA